MFKKIYNLLKILRKLSVSGAVETLDEIRPIPKSLKIIFNIFSIGSSKKIENLKKSSGEKLCQSLEDMGTTFIKLGQFLATRPDIIGEEIAKKLEKLQDKLPAFNKEKAKNIAQAGYEFVIENLTWEVLLPKYVRFYEDLVKS